VVLDVIADVSVWYS